MKVFVGYGYNDRDRWIEGQVFPILRGMGFQVVDGKNMHGKTLQDEVKSRIDQSDALIGFLTLRDGQGDADFTSHIWVRDELVHAQAREKPIVMVKEKGVKVPAGLFGNRQYITLDSTDRLACVVELVRALGRRKMRRLKLDPANDDLTRKIMKWRRSEEFKTRYRTQDEAGLESAFRDGRLEMVDQGFFLNVSDLPKNAYVEVEGRFENKVEFSSGWVSADAVQVKIF